MKSLSRTFAILVCALAAGCAGKVHEPRAVTVEPQAATASASVDGTASEAQEPFEMEPVAVELPMPQLPEKDHSARSLPPSAKAARSPAEAAARPRPDMTARAAVAPPIGAHATM